MAHKLNQTFTIAEAAKYSGLKPAMVDYLCRSGTLRPSCVNNPGRGKPRKYFLNDIVMLRAIAKMLKSGVAVSRLRKALATWRKLHNDSKSRAPAKRYLLTDGKKVYFVNGLNEIEELTADGQLAFCFVLELDQIRNEVSRTLKPLRRNAQ